MKYFASHKGEKSHGNVWVHRFAILAAVTTLPLIFVGGLVTSHDVGMSVPDWPTSFGYNMFLFPWSKWVGGIRYEHPHRLLGSLLGIIAFVLTFLVVKHEKQRRWLRILTLVTLALIVLQGNLGGYRVWLNMRPIAIFHACLGQIVFCMLCAIALFTSKWWANLSNSAPTKDHGLRKLSIFTIFFIFVQLILGAVMRHTEAGLAVPDFPLIYGHLTPPLNIQDLERVNEQRIWRWGLDPVSFFQINIHLAHRLWAFVVSGAILIMIKKIFTQHRNCRSLKQLGFVLGVLLLLQLSLGAFVIWTEKAADIATLHVAVGSLTFATSVLLSLACYKLLAVEGKSVLMEVPTVEGMVT